MKDDCEIKEGIEIAVNKTEIEHLKDDIKEIKTNHLPHIYDRLGRLETKIAYWSGGIAVLMIALNILTQIIQWMSK